jgi:tetratricopeptide (TPR) repeat protein
VQGNLAIKGMTLKSFFVNNESAKSMIDALKITTEFLSNNSYVITIIIVILIFKKPISDLISRISKLTVKQGRASLGLETIAPLGGVSPSKSPHSTDGKPTSNDADSKIDEIEVKEGAPLALMHAAFREGRFEDAKVAFEQYSSEEEDKAELHSRRGFYQYLMFVKAKDNSAIEELRELARKAYTEDSKFNSLVWLSFCFELGMEYEKQVVLWNSALIEIKSEKLKNKIIINLTIALNDNAKSTEAKNVLVKRLLATVDNDQKSALYETLSTVEKSLGQKSLSIYCSDKALEFDANNREKLFDSAYEASEEGFNEISISNYIKLLKIDSDNSLAINNLGVKAQEADLNIKAIEHFKKSSGHNNTLAMANQGYALLRAGFGDEAKELANRALKADKPHENIYSLVTAINEAREEEGKKWAELQEKSLERQKIIRRYTGQFYHGNPKLLEGDWVVGNASTAKITISHGRISASWGESAAIFESGSFTAGINGRVSGSTFEGEFTRKRDGGSVNSLLGGGGEIHQECIGYISEEGNEIIMTSPKLIDNFSRRLSKAKV